MLNGFVPAKGLSNAHVQTIWPFLFRKVPSLNRRRERFTTPDNDFFDVDCYGNSHKGIVILMHGLMGCSSSHYILGLQDVLEREGYSTAAINFRASSGEPNLKAFSYHAGFTNDIDQLYRTIRSKNPSTPIFTVGFSLGGNIMLKWLGERANDLEISGSVAISVPYKLDNCADKVDTGLSKIYRQHLIGAMKNKLAGKLKFFDENNMLSESIKLRALGDIGWIKSFWEFDHHVVATLNGFDGVNDYYRKNSAIHFLDKIKTPLLLIHSKDDPFTTSSVLPSADQISSTTKLNVTEKGGHVGFLSRAPTGGLDYWLEKRIVSFLDI